MRKSKSEKGFTLTALIVAIGVMSVLLAVAIPIWSRIAKREREEELIFRGNQYIIAINRFYGKFQRLPISLEELKKTKCIRKLYPDPMTKDGTWDLIYYPTSGPNKNIQQKRIRQSRAIATRSIIGVISKSTDKALRPYREKWYYNEWQFTYKAKIENKEKHEKQRKTPTIKKKINKKS